MGISMTIEADNAVEFAHLLKRLLKEFEGVGPAVTPVVGFVPKGNPLEGLKSDPELLKKLEDAKPGEVVETGEIGGKAEPEPPKRSRRTKAEMEAARAADRAAEPEQVAVEGTQAPAEEAQGFATDAAGQEAVTAMFNDLSNVEGVGFDNAKAALRRVLDHYHVKKISELSAATAAKVLRRLPTEVKAA